MKSQACLSSLSLFSAPYVRHKKENWLEDSLFLREYQLKDRKYICIIYNNYVYIKYLEITIHHIRVSNTVSTLRARLSFWSAQEQEFFNVTDHKPEILGKKQKQNHRGWEGSQQIIEVLLKQVPYNRWPR